MKVRFTDSGEIGEFNSEVELVNHMRKTAKAYYKNNRDYMMSFAIRAVEWNDMDIRATNEMDFINDLKAANLIECDL